MKVFELFEAQQWFPDKPHPAVETDPLAAGMSRTAYPDLIHQLEAGKGKIGIFWQAISKPHGWLLVHPGDWLVRRWKNYELVKKADFDKRFKRE